MTTTDREVREIAGANDSGHQPVVFVHGLWLLAGSWDKWREFYATRGYATLAPGWPDDPETVQEAHAHPDVFAGKSIGQVTGHYAEVIAQLTRKPIVIGHSFGGLITQKLAGQGLCAGSVAIDPAPFRGVKPLPLSALKAAMPALKKPGNRNRAVALTFEQFRFAFANAVTEAGTASCTTHSVAGPGLPLVPSRVGQPQPGNRGECRHQPRGAGAAVDHRGREGQHGAVEHREHVVQALPARGRADRDRQDFRPRALAHDRQRVAGGRRDRPEVPRRSRAAPVAVPGPRTVGGTFAVPVHAVPVVPDLGRTRASGWRAVHAHGG